MPANLLTVFCVALAACDSPEPALARDTVVADTGKRVRALDGRLSVPRGFKVAYFAKELKGVRMMALGPSGVVYASQPRSSRVVRLPDANRDNVADSIQVAVSGLTRPTGLAFRGDWLYIANSDALVRVRLDANGLASGKPEELAKFSGTNGHSTRTVVIGADSALYVSIGSSCNLCIEEHEDRATVMRYDLDGKNGRVFSKGLRNAVGVAVHPSTKEIWVTTHERDNLKPDHQNLPPEEIDILKDGADYGWPYCHSDRVPNPEYNDRARCASTELPALMMQAHSAPLGIAFLANAKRFPKDYRGDALVAFHGSWNRDQPTGAKVVRIRTAKNKPVRYEDFVTGWQLKDGSRWGRPVDVVVTTDGSVLISDDDGGAIYRVYR